MLRIAVTRDREAILAVVLATGLLEADEVDSLGAILDGSLMPATSAAPSLWVVDDDSGSIVGVAYTQPEPMADGARNLRLIAVHPERQREGRGAALLTFVEQALTGLGGRLLVVDTSGHPDFEGVRNFYRRGDYVQEATIRDFWQPGDGKVVLSVT